MKKPVLFLCCLLALIAVSCGGRSNMMMQPTPMGFPPLNGSLSFAAASQVANTNTFNVGGPLMVDSNGNVTATLAIASVTANVASACFPAGSMMSFTGMLTPQGRLTLASAAFNGQVVNLAVTVSPDGNFFSNGSFTVTGGCLGGDHGGLTVNHLVSGMFTGSMMLNGNLVNVTVNFNPPGIPQLDGSFPISAGATFSNNTACVFTSAGTEGGGQSGLAVGFTMMSNATSIVTFGGTSIDSSASMVSGSFGVVGGTCDQMKASVTLKKS